MATMRGEITLGLYTNQRGTEPRVQLGRADRFHHVYTLGRTGLGKSTLLRNMVLQDLEAGDGLMLIDPHGDLVEAVLEHVPRDRAGDVVYFNPADRAHPAGFNLLQTSDPDEHPLVVSGVVAAFRHLWGDSWGPRLEYILSNAVAAVLAHGHGTLLGVLRILSDEDYRENVLTRVRDPYVLRFWEEEFADYDKRFRTEAIAPVQNKLGRLLANPLLRNILGQVTSTVDLDWVANEGKVLLVNLSSGKLGEDGKHFLGSLLISRLQLTAMRRAYLPEEQRRDFFVFVDEFQHFASDAFAELLSEARKYRVGLTLSHQYVHQLEPAMQHAILGNVGNIVAFGIGAHDAEVLSPALPLPARNLVELDKFRVWARLLQDGVTREPIGVKTLPPRVQHRPASPDRLRKRSRQHFARRRDSVEHKIDRWLAA